MEKPSKPYPDFPLTPHPAGQWVKKIRGKIRYFGKWADPETALAKYTAYLATIEPSNVTPVENASKSDRPKKPNRGFPLYAHANGQWCAKLGGRSCYFGPWSNPQAALTRFLFERENLLNGHVPVADASALTVWGLVNNFLESKQDKLTAGELAQRTLDDYVAIGTRIIKTLGEDRLVATLSPADFSTLRAALGKGRGVITLLNDIGKARVIFNFAQTQFDVKVRYGDQFKKPSRSAQRKASNQRAPKYITAGKIRQMLDSASVPMRAMILLAINCAFGNTDCARLTLDHLDLERGRHKFPRPKTGVKRRCPLWPETVEALQAVLASRPKPRDRANANRVFITHRGNTWEKTKDDNPISKEFTSLTKSLGIHRLGVGFYSLRHTFQSVGDASGEGVAVSFIMGHVPSSSNMAAVYREKVFSKNIRRVSKYVRKWLLATKESIEARSSQHIEVTSTEDVSASALPDTAVDGLSMSSGTAGTVVG